MLIAYGIPAPAMKYAINTPLAFRNPNRNPIAIAVNAIIKNAKVNFVGLLPCIVLIVVYLKVDFSSSIMECKRYKKTINDMIAEVRGSAEIPIILINVYPKMICVIVPERVANA